MSANPMNSAKVVGSVQLAIAFGKIITDIVALAGFEFGYYGSLYGSGIISGIWMIIGGSLGISAGRALRAGEDLRGRRCQTVAFMVLGVLTTLQGFSLALYAILMITTGELCLFFIYSSHSSCVPLVDTILLNVIAARLALEILTFIIGIATCVVYGKIQHFTRVSTAHVTYTTTAAPNMYAQPAPYGQAAYGQPTPYPASASYPQPSPYGQQKV